MKNHSDIWDIIEEKSPAYFDFSDTVWNNPETNYEDYKANDAHTQILLDEGFRVERGIAGLPTAMIRDADAARIMSSTAAESFRHPERIASAKADHKKRLGGTVFIHLIPDDVQPALPDQAR